MRKVMNLVLGGIQQKIFNLVLVTIILMIAAYTSVTVYQYRSISSLVKETSEAQQGSITEISSDTMKNVVNESLGQTTLLESYIANSLFEELKNETLMLTGLTEKLYENPDGYGSVTVERPSPGDDGRIITQLLTDEGVDISDPGIAYSIGLLGNLSDEMESMYETANINSCFVGTPEGLFIITDDRSGVKFDDSGSLRTFPVTDRPWYKGAIEKGEIFFTDVEKDAFTDQIGIVCSCPVYSDGRLVAVVGIDMFLDSMEEAIEASSQEGRFISVVNQYGHVVFSSAKGGQFEVRTDGETDDLRESPDPELSAFVRDALRTGTDVRLVSADGNEWYMAGVPMESVGWTFISAVDAGLINKPSEMMADSFNEAETTAIETFEKNLKKSRTTIIVLIGIIFVLGTVASLTVAGRIVSPIKNITRRIASLGGDDLQFKMRDEYRTGDEIEVLAESFANLSRRTLQYVSEVKRITGEKERIGAELSMAKAIQASQLPHLFPAFPDRKEFDVYASMTPAKEVGGDFYDFFLVDDDHIALVMADVSGKGVPAALFMMVSRILIRNRVQAGESPANTLFTVNNQLLEGDEAQLFVTVWLCILQLSTGKAIVANAGHEHPAVRRAGGKYELVIYKHSPAVATYPDMEYTEHEFQMYPGDSFFVYTDGVAEATNSEEKLFGTGRMLEALNRDPDATPEKTLDNVREAIRNFVMDAEQFDDITMLALKYIGTP